MTASEKDKGRTRYGTCWVPTPRKCPRPAILRPCLGRHTANSRSVFQSRRGDCSIDVSRGGYPTLGPFVHGAPVVYVTSDPVRSLAAAHGGGTDPNYRPLPTQGRSYAWGLLLTEVASLSEREIQIAGLLGKRFVQRRDAKAEQNKINGTWHRCVQDRRSQADVPIKMPDVITHVRGERSFGHYLLDNDDMSRVFALDIDLRKESTSYPTFTPNFDTELHEYIPREAWQDWSHPSRYWTKLSLRVLAEKFSRIIVGELGLPCLVTYSGSKGLHIYGFFDEPVPAADAREGAIITIEQSGLFKPKRGKSFYEAISQDPVDGYPQLDIEAYPKQEKKNSNGYGNLMRLPLGRNFKSPHAKEHSFFVDLMAPGAEISPLDPLLALTTRDPWIMGRLPKQTGA